MRYDDIGMRLQNIVKVDAVRLIRMKWEYFVFLFFLFVRIFFSFATRKDVRRRHFQWSKRMDWRKSKNNNTIPKTVVQTVILLLVVGTEMVCWCDRMRNFCALNAAVWGGLSDIFRIDCSKYLDKNGRIKGSPRSPH